jgi:hypothetical protein
MAAPQVDPYQAQSRKSNTLIFVGLVLLALMGGFALGKGGLFSRSGEIAGQGQRIDLNAPGKSGGGQLQVPEQPLDLPIQLGFDPSAPDLRQGYQPGAGPQVADKMPQDVRDWLLHLERTESERNRMTKAQMGQALAVLFGSTRSTYEDLLKDIDGEDPDAQALQNPELNNQFAKAAPKMRAGWRDLTTYFNSKQPPAECIPIKNAYEQCLAETGSMMVDLIGAIEASREADADFSALLEKVSGMQGTSESKIDQFGVQTDEMVGQICHKYDTWKWFSISGDIGSGLGGLGIGGGLSGLGGMLGGG